MVYAELRSIAEHRLRSLGPSATLQPTELLNEAYLRLTRRGTDTFNGKAHFIAAAALAMRSILVDRARAANTAKRGGSQTRITLEAADIAIDREPAEVLSVDQALTKLESIDPRSAKVVMMRFYLGLGTSEIAFALSVTERTVERDWAFAKRWLARELIDAQSPRP
jgi:RNA polymerase sigma factor (TIGR02999 family)